MQYHYTPTIKMAIGKRRKTPSAKNSHTLLMRVKIGTTTLENYFIVLL